LYRVPQIIDTISTALLYLGGTAELASIATDTIERMTNNLQNSTETLSPGASMGDQVERIAGGNLERGTESYDYFDKENQIAGQIQGTRATSSPESLIAVLRRGVNKLDSAPKEVNTTFTNGQPAAIIKANLKTRFLLQAIPSKPVGWNFKAFILQVQQLEEETKIIIKLVPTKTLD
jgi:hypothetical protein